jgi:hypothetical protein
MDKYTIECRVWDHHSPTGQTDFYGAMRFVVSDNHGFVHDHYGCLQAAQDAIASLEDESDNQRCPHCGERLAD